MSTTITMWLGIAFVALAIGATILQAWLWSFPMVPDPGGPDPNGKSTAPRSWTMIHRTMIHRKMPQELSQKKIQGLMAAIPPPQCRGSEFCESPQISRWEPEPWGS